MLQFVSVCRAGKLPGEKLYPCGSTIFRKRFRQAIQALGWEELDIQPYSLRRGGATDFFRQTNSMQQVEFRGRWANFQTATLYVDAALPAGGSFELPADHEERAIYVADGAAEVDGEPVAAASTSATAPATSWACLSPARPTGR